MSYRRRASKAIVKNKGSCIDLACHSYTGKGPKNERCPCWTDKKGCTCTKGMLAKLARAKGWLEAHPKKAKIKQLRVYQEGSKGLWLCTKVTEDSCCFHKVTIDPLCREVPEDELSYFTPYTGKEEALTEEALTKEDIKECTLIAAEEIVKQEGGCDGLECFAFDREQTPICPCALPGAACCTTATESYASRKKEKLEIARKYVQEHEEKASELSQEALEQLKTAEYTRFAALWLIKHKGSCLELTSEMQFNPCKQPTGNCPCWNNRCLGVTLETDTGTESATDKALRIAQQWLTDHPSKEEK